MQALLDKGRTRRGIMNGHQEAAYAGRDRTTCRSPKPPDSVILLPLYHSMTDEEQDYVIGLVKSLGGSREGPTPGSEFRPA